MAPITPVLNVVLIRQARSGMSVRVTPGERMGFGLKVGDGGLERRKKMRVNILQELIRVAYSKGIYADYQDDEDDLIVKILIILMGKI